MQSINFYKTNRFSLEYENVDSRFNQNTLYYLLAEDAVVKDIAIARRGRGSIPGHSNASIFPALRHFNGDVLPKRQTETSTARHMLRRYF